MSKRFLLLQCILLFIAAACLACQKPNSQMPEVTAITRYDSLLSHEGDTVQVIGTFIKHNAMPQFGESNAVFRPGILMEGDSLPKLFLFREMGLAEMDSLDGKKVMVSGVFAREQRLGPDDPPHAARMSGSWLYEVEGLVAVE